MLNPLKNPLVVQTVLDKAAQELNQAIIYRKMQFNNDQLYLWVEAERTEDMPYISLRDEQANNIVRMTGAELLEDKAIQLQLKKIPAFVRPFIKFQKIVPVMNQRIMQFLQEGETLKITEARSEAKIDLYQGNELKKENVKLTDIFG